MSAFYWIADHDLVGERLLLAAVKRRGTVMGVLLFLLVNLWMRVAAVPWFIGLHARRLGGAVSAGVHHWRAERAYSLERKKAWEEFMQQRRAQR